MKDVAAKGFALVLLMFNLCSLAAAPHSRETENISRKNIREVYRALQELRLNDQRVALVENFSFTRDRARLHLQHGWLVLAQPVAGRITGAIFFGKGRFTLNPPDEIDRYQIRRFTDRDSIAEPFTAAYVRFTDSTAVQLQRRLTFLPRNVPEEAGKLHARLSRLLLEERGLNLAAAVLSDLANRPANGFFFAALEQGTEHENFPSYILFYHDVRARESVAAYQYFPHRVNKPFYTLCAYSGGSGAPADSAAPEAGDASLNIRHYQGRILVEKNGNIRVRSELAFSPAIDRVQFLTLDLYADLHVDSVTTVGGDTLEFFQEKKQASFSVYHDVPLPESKIIVHYSGKALEPSDEGLYRLKNNQYWLPRMGYLEPATYDFLFRAPKQYQLVATGRLMDARTDKKYAWFRWKNETPMFGAAFEMGLFDSTSFRQNDERVTVFSSRNRSRSLRKQVAGDIGDSIYIFEHLFGALPFASLQVIESPQNTSFGYPNTLFLSARSFNPAAEGVMETHRGHETAHQWWGNLVRWQSYHDQWLSEGLAEYCGALINQFLFDGDKVFFATLRGWRDDLLEKGHIGVSVGLRNFGFSKRDLAQSDGLKAGPIWLGRRLGEKHPVDYFLIVYEKGAYVFHMLRTMLRDFRSNSDARFFDLLADFAHRYRFKPATTADFQRLAEKHAGEKLDWFFRQWLYGWQVPTYRYSEDILHDARGFRVKLTVQQKGVPEAFTMPVPVTVQFAGATKLTKKIVMTGREMTFTLGPFPNKPEKVIFNDYDGVLAHVKRR